LTEIELTLLPVCCIYLTKNTQLEKMLLFPFTVINMFSLLYYILRFALLGFANSPQMTHAMMHQNLAKIL